MLKLIILCYYGRRIRKEGILIPLGFYVMNIFKQQGFILKDIIIKEQHNCKFYFKGINIKHSFYLLAHEYIFIFEKK